MSEEEDEDLGRVRVMKRSVRGGTLIEDDIDTENAIISTERTTRGGSTEEEKKEDS
ncbi:MAG: hypothetical protein ACP6IS_10030 [Candidatus Asgardarchaeia archaeon]